MADNSIQLRTITELLGNNFHIPDYQRGYRWTKENVTQLLDDIWEYRTKGTAHTFYCLQPIVISDSSWQDKNGNNISGFELIDGQQRLTTIHRIITYLQLNHLQNDLKSEGYLENLYSIYYQTRLESESFLKTDDYNATMPDLYYMSEAYRTIKAWFEDGEKGVARQVREKMLNVLLPSIVKNAEGKLEEPEWSVQVIWYKIALDEYDIDKNNKLFKRLNRGKIPLTSAELIKAKFVNSQSLSDLPNEEQIKKKTVLIQIWDEIEVKLNNPKFWAFISNKKQENYSNKIDLLFDTITKKSDKELDPLYSFIHFFDKEENSKTLWDKWIRVEEIFRALVFWFREKEYYHKIGFLIEFGVSINELIDIKKDNLKSDFVYLINDMIAEILPVDWEDLRFDVANDYKKILKVLMLHNLEILRKNENTEEFFPFHIYKNITKSIEHIHAQNIEDINPNNKEEWKAWLKAHIPVLKESDDNKEVIDKIKENFDSGIAYKEFSNFKTQAQKILDLIPQEEENNDKYLHKIENLALLGLKENIVLSNSVFEVKRRRILEMDKNGEFIPIATKRIFLKYYNNDSTPQYNIWAEAERENYKKDIKETLKVYFDLLIKETEDED